MPDLDDIPQDKRSKFPTGVSEQCFKTRKEMTAFLMGLNYAGDGDVSNGEVFSREGMEVVRIRVGEFGDE